MHAARLVGQPVHALVGGAERARRALAAVVVAVGLFGTAIRAGADERRQLLFAVMLVCHGASLRLGRPALTRGVGYKLRSPGCGLSATVG